jgi:hypothetical protein
MDRKLHGCQMGALDRLYQQFVALPEIREWISRCHLTPEEPKIEKVCFDWSIVPSWWFRQFTHEVN